MTYMDLTPPHLTVAEFAARMSMEGHMVRRRIRNRQIRAVNIGHPNRPEYRIPETELARYVAEHAA